MKLLIEIPTWLGDAIMCTPAINNIIKEYPNAQIILFGSYVSTQALGQNKNISKIIIDDSKKGGNRYLNLIKLTKKVGFVDMAISFRKSFASKFMMFFVSAKKKYSYEDISKKTRHQVVKYNDFINHSLNINRTPDDLELNIKPYRYAKPTLGINPGATYGSAKRWYALEFAKVAVALSKEYDIVIFGGPGEVNIAKDIEAELINSNIINYENLAGKTDIKQLVGKIAGLSLFITNDSGPMHVAASFKIKTYCIFGPTKFTETNQWNNPNEHIITKNLECAPCMKRICPLKHHDCMKQITASDVLEVIGE